MGRYTHVPSVRIYWLSLLPDVNKNTSLLLLSDRPWTGGWTLTIRKPGEKGPRDHPESRNVPGVPVLPQRKREITGKANEFGDPKKMGEMVKYDVWPYLERIQGEKRRTFLCVREKCNLKLWLGRTINLYFIVFTIWYSLMLPIL